MLLIGVNRPGRGETGVTTSRSPGLGAEVIPNRPLKGIRQQHCCDPAGERNEYSWAPQRRGCSLSQCSMFRPWGRESTALSSELFFNAVEAWLHPSSIDLPWWSTPPSTHSFSNSDMHAWNGSGGPSPLMMQATHRRCAVISKVHRRI